MSLKTPEYKLTDDELGEYQEILTEKNESDRYIKFNNFCRVLRDKYNLNAKKPIEVTDEGYVLYVNRKI